MTIHPTLHSQIKRTVLLRLMSEDESYITKRTPVVSLDTLTPPLLVLVLCIMFMNHPTSLQEQVNYHWTPSDPRLLVEVKRSTVFDDDQLAFRHPFIKSSPQFPRMQTIERRTLNRLITVNNCIMTYLMSFTDTCRQLS
jgi:hypothetical protein